MKIKTNAWLMSAVAGACLFAGHAHAQWLQNSSVGPFNYTDPANWTAGNLNGQFTSTPWSGLTIQFPNDYTFTNTSGVVFGYGTVSNVTFQSSSATARTLKLLGNILVTNSQGATITIGTAANPLILDLNGATRLFGGSTPNGAANSTININAQIIDSSGNTNGVNLSANRVFTYLLNNNNTFIGPVNFTSFRGGGFSSIKNIGGSASALGAPTDSTNGTITVGDSSSNGSLKYSGTGDTSDRPFVWNLTFAGPTVGNGYSFQNVGLGLLKLTGPQKMPTGANAEFVISAISNSIEFDGYLNSTNGGNAYLQFTGTGNTNRIILNGPTNDFSALEVNGAVTLAYNTISNAALPCSLGTNGNIYIKNGCLQYIGTNAFATNNRIIYLAGSPTSWSLDNANSNTLLINNLVCTNLTGNSTNFNAATNGPAGARALNLGAYSASDSGPSGTLLVPAIITDASSSNSVQVVAAGPVTFTVFNGGTVGLLATNNTFSGGVQIKYSRTLQVMSLADSNTPCSIGLGTNPPATFAGITFGSTDSQRGGILSYIGTNNAACNRQIAVLGTSGTANNFTILNNSPNNSSLRFSSPAPVACNAAALNNCAITLGGTAVANNEFDLQITNAPTGNTSLTISGSYWLLTAANTYSSNTTVSAGTLALGATASIASSPKISIAAGATLDVSAAGITFTGSSPQQTLAASTSSGTATINAPSKTVTLNSSALLSFPATGGSSTTVGKISVSGASANLTLNNNTVTVNVSGSALAAGTYRLLDCTGTLTGSANATPALTGTALSSGYTATISTTTGAAGHVDLIVKATPSFSNLSSKTIVYGTGSVIVTGTVSSSGGPTTVYPANGETVTATINGHAVNGTVTNTTGAFYITYNDPSLATDGVGSSPYTITYIYAGNSATLNAAANNTSTTLSVNPLPGVLTGTRAYDGTTNASAGILSVANKVGTDDVSVGSGVSGLAGYTVGTQSVTSFGTLTLAGTTAGNYTLTGASGSVVITQALPAMSVMSTLNPAGYLTSLSFTATLPSDATGTVTFLTNGTALSTSNVTSGPATGPSISNLPRGTNIIAALYSGDGNYLAATNFLNQIVTNHPPVASTMTVVRAAGLALKIALSDLATNWSDVDGDTVTLSSVNLTTTNNVTLSTNAAYIFYTNSPNVNDQFTYTIGDGHGGSVTCTVNITLVTGAAGQSESVTITGATATVSFAGIPNYSYSVQRSTNLVDWATIWTTNAPMNGLFNYTDDFSDLGGPPSAAYYRLGWSP